MLSPRAAVLRMSEYHPPLSGRDGLRLDFNENTSGCSPRVLAELAKITAEQLTRYPERASVERIVADKLQVAPDQLLLTNGVDEAIHLLCETYLELADEALIVVPTFGMYALYVQQTGAQLRAVQANEDFSFPLERVLDAITPSMRFIAFASPNNPTGAVVPQDALERVLLAAPEAAVLVDEAYFDFYGVTMLPLLGKYSNLFIARTFSKAYGLAGLRAGVLVGPAQQLSYLRKVSSPYNVNGIALSCLQVAMEDQGYVRDYVSQIHQGRRRLEGALEKYELHYWPSHANFILLRIGPLHREFVSAMLRRKILVRDRDRDPGCAGCVRITIGTPPQMDLLLAALPECLEEIGWPATLERAQ